MTLESVQAEVDVYGVPSYKRVIPRVWLKLAAVILIVGTTVGSFLPGPAKRALGTHPDNHFHAGHRLFHFATFGLTTAVLLLLAERLRDEVKAVLFVAVWGCAIELAQYGTALSGVFEWWDARDDVYAAVIVFLLAQMANAFTGRAGR